MAQMVRQCQAGRLRIRVPKRHADQLQRIGLIASSSLLRPKPVSSESRMMFRRGLATEAHQLGVVDRNIQSQLRHADPNVTRKLHMREVPEEQKKAMELLSDAAMVGKN